MMPRRECWLNPSTKCEGCSLWIVTSELHRYKTPRAGAMDPHVYTVCGKCFDRLLARDCANP